MLVLMTNATFKGSDYLSEILIILGKFDKAVGNLYSALEGSKMDQSSNMALRLNDIQAAINPLDAARRSPRSGLKSGFFSADSRKIEIGL